MKIENCLDLEDAIFYIIILLVIIRVRVKMNSNQSLPSVIDRVTLHLEGIG